MTKKIAFLFLIIDNPNFPDIWDEYFKNNDGKYSIYIHTKYPCELKWHKENMIKTVQTGWGFIIDAYIQLFKEAYKDPFNIKFITVSESCVPIKKFEDFYDFVITKNSSLSLIKTMKISGYDYNVRLTDEIKKKFNHHLIKHYARMCLSRTHVKQLIENKNKNNIEMFAKMHVGDEFFLSCISPLKNYIDFAVIHDDWEYVEKIKKSIKNKIKLLYEEQEKNNNLNNINKINDLRNEYNDIAKNPKKIIKVSKEDLYNMKNTESFFYRKFDKNSDIQKYIGLFIG